MQITSLFNGVEAVVMDMDGVLWRGDVLLPRVGEFFAFLRQHDLPFVLATNNSSRTVSNYLQKLAGFGINARPENIVTSSVATAYYLRQHQPNGLRVHIVGEQGLHDILTEAGFTIVDDGADVVVAGIDRYLTYDKLRTANRLIYAGAEFIGTNGDLTFPVPEGVAPGAGSVLAALQASTGQPPRIMGKPEPIMFEMALDRLGVAASACLMIGDRLETDILGGINAGMRTALVLSGVTSAAQAAAADIQADAVYPDLGHVLDAWRAERA